MKNFFSLREVLPPGENVRRNRSDQFRPEASITAW